MAENPIGTTTDEERLVPLFADDDGFRVDVTNPVQTADVPEDGTFALYYREQEDAPRLVAAPVEDDEDAGDLFTTDVATTDGKRTLAVPEQFVADGLGLDPAGYDNDNPLLFEPDELTGGVAVGMTLDGEPGSTVENGIELRPLRYADGAPYSDEPLFESSMDSDPVVEETLAHERGEDGTPQSGTISAPLDAAYVDGVLETSDASRAAVVEALETIARDGLVAQADDDSTRAPLVADDRMVVVLNDENWAAKVAEELDADETTVDAVRRIHARQADELLAQADGEWDTFVEWNPVVVQPTRHYESDEPPDEHPGSDDRPQ